MEEPAPANNQELITLMASDATTIQVPKQAIKPILEHLKGKPSTSDDDTTTIPADFVNAKGLTYLKEYLETPDDKKHTVVQKLISNESVETIYGLNRFLDCWELLQENSLSKIEEQLKPLGLITKAIVCGSIAYAITFNGHFLKIDLKNKSVESLFNTNDGYLYELATNSHQNIFYFGGSGPILHIFYSNQNKFDHIPQISRLSIKNIRVSPNDSLLLVGDEWTEIYDQFLNNKGKIFCCYSSILITTDSQHIISYGMDGNPYSLTLPTKTAKRLKKNP